MPIYEYLCEDCSRVFSTLVLSQHDQEGLKCPQCQGKKLKKQISSFSYHRSEGSRLNEFNHRARQGDEFYHDSRNIGLWAKKKAKDLGVDLGPKFEERLEQARTDPGKFIKDYET